MERQQHSTNAPASNVLLEKRILATYYSLKRAMQPLVEIYYGIRTRTIPWLPCAIVAAIVSLSLYYRVDLWLYTKIATSKVPVVNSIFRFGLRHLYPFSSPLYWVYFSCLTLSGFFVWGLWLAQVRWRLKDKLENAFEVAGLRNRLGKTPQLIYDIPLDVDTRKIKITNAKFPLTDFKKNQASLESALQIYIDEIKERRSHGTIEITYCLEPLEDKIEYSRLGQVPPRHFPVGFSRARTIIPDFEKVPHLLVAGQTSGGKSTFLRQFITTVYLGNKTFHFTLIDLKGGLEFQLFENLPRVKVIPNLQLASHSLKKFHAELELRMKLLKENKCKDITEYLKIPDAEKKVIAEFKAGSTLSRHLIVVDEAADLFLAGASAPSGEIQKAKRVLSEIGRKGRAVGLHLVIATQRPDSRALDPQIKLNLPGVLCFQMANDASSISVLGNGRATDLPAIAGRAIWKCGTDMIEVQTPLILPAEVDELLKKHRTATDAVATQEEDLGNIDDQSDESADPVVGDGA